jgi:hypothetical protein
MNTNGSKTFVGAQYRLEQLPDGTGLVRDVSTNRPVKAVVTREITEMVRTLEKAIDELARDAVPASWGPRG